MEERFACQQGWQRSAAQAIRRGVYVHIEGKEELQLRRTGFDGKIHLPLILSACVSSLGGFLFGYDNIVISAAIGNVTRYHRLEPVARTRQ